MWIKVLKNIGEYKTGDTIEVEKAVGDSYVAAKLAEESQVDTAAAMADEIRDSLSANITEIVRAQVAEVVKGLKRPNVGFEFQTLEAGESEADKTKSNDDFVRCVVISNGPERPDDQRAAIDRLSKVYKSTNNIERAVTGSSGSTGGWSIPVTMESEMLAVAAEDSVIMEGATKVPMNTREHKWPVLDQYSAPAAGQSAFFGGVQVYRKGEGVARTETQIVEDQLTLHALDLTALIHLDRDTVMDAGPALVSTIAGLAGGAIGWRREWEALFGNGINQSQGITTSPALISVLRETANTITFRDTRRLYRCLIPAHRKTACWVINPFSMDTILGLKDDANRNLFLPWYEPGGMGGTPPGGPITATPSGRLFGLPLFETEKAPPLGSANDLMLIHRASYMLGTLGGVEMGMTDLFRYDVDQITIKVKLRDAGTPRLRKSIILADGAGTTRVSAFAGLSATAG